MLHTCDKSLRPDPPCFLFCGLDSLISPSRRTEDKKKDCATSVRACCGVGGVGGAAALMIAEERTTLDSIHALLDTIEGDKRGLLSQIEGYKARCNDLRAANQRLERKLELATQRFELAVARASCSGLRSSQVPSRQPTGDSSGIPDSIGNSLEPGAAPPAADTGFQPPLAPSGMSDSQWSLQRGHARSGGVPELPDDGRGQSGAAIGSSNSPTPPQMPGQSPPVPGAAPVPVQHLCLMIKPSSLLAQMLWHT